MSNRPLRLTHQICQKLQVAIGNENFMKSNEKFLKFLNRDGIKIGVNVLINQKILDSLCPVGNRLESSCPLDRAKAFQIQPLCYLT